MCTPAAVGSSVKSAYQRSQESQGKVYSPVTGSYEDASKKRPVLSITDNITYQQPSAPPPTTPRDSLEGTMGRQVAPLRSPPPTPARDPLEGTMGRGIAPIAPPPPMPVNPPSPRPGVQMEGLQPGLYNISGTKKKTRTAPTTNTRSRSAGIGGTATSDTGSTGLNIPT